MEAPARGPAIPRLHVVTDDAVLARVEFPRRAAGLLSAGGGAVALHVRGPGTPGGPIREAARARAGPARASGACLGVNDRVDVALAGGAAGAHLGVRSLPVPEARRLLGPARLLGVSVHSEAEGASAAAEGADWIFAGTIYDTASHPGLTPKGPAFVERVAEASAGVTPPIASTGTPGRVAEVLAHGAAGVAVIRGIW
ncbi:MAG: thiamine phosphate synthase, partial [Gemmatimonadetes bacterium]|nr:thiamine phosphate synthase [Gemmatimonadota bacterium]